MELVDVGYDDTRFTNVVDQDLHCAICLNVLKEPMQCLTNEHHFCAPCIKRHLENFQTCPSCMDELTLDTLRKPSRFLTRSLAELVICCEYVDRGCHEVMSLSDLKTHLANCEYSPVKCCNEGCNEVINRREKNDHENLACKFRKWKCEYCRETGKDIDEIKLRLAELSDLKGLKDQMSHMLAQMNCLTQTVKILCPQNNRMKEDIIVAGGRNTRRLNSAERFSWLNKSWMQLQPMRENRSGASSVVYENKMVVTGGRCTEVDDTDTMEAINFDNSCVAATWFNMLPKLPSKRSAHQTLMYKDRLFLIGGSDISGTAFKSIYEIFLTPSSACNLVCRMPRAVCFHGAERFDNNIFIFGGSLSTKPGRGIDCVVKYNIQSQKCLDMPPLPYAIKRMATVKWQRNVVIVGGIGPNRTAVDTVIMYNISTGESKMLPNMKYRRYGCSAVTVGNEIVVMGGHDENNVELSSVECFSFDRSCWEDLPPMIEPRAFATAAVKCNNFA